MVEKIKLKNANEGFYILDEYGLKAFLYLTATGHDPINGIRTLNTMKEHFIKEEDYLKCAKIQDCINVLWVDEPDKQGLKIELGILV
jgi:hypothetical protein